MTIHRVTPGTTTYTPDLSKCHASVCVFPKPEESLLRVETAQLDGGGEPYRITCVEVGSVVRLQFDTPAAARLWLEATLNALDCVVSLEVETVRLAGL